MNFKEAIETAKHSPKHYIKRMKWDGVWIKVPICGLFKLRLGSNYYNDIIFIDYCPDMDSLFANDWVVIE